MVLYYSYRSVSILNLPCFCIFFEVRAVQRGSQSPCTTQDPSPRGGASHQPIDLATLSTTLFSLPAFSSDRSLEAAMESSRSLCFERSVLSSASSNGRTLLT